MPRTASMSMLVSMPQSGLMPRLGSIPRGWAREVRYGRHRVGARVPNLHWCNEVGHAFHYLMHQHPRVVCPISCLQVKVTLFYIVISHYTRLRSSEILFGIHCLPYKKRDSECYYAKQLRTGGALKKKRCVYNLPADWKHTSDTSLPIKGKSSDGSAGWSLDWAVYFGCIISWPKYCSIWLIKLIKVEQLLSG